MWMWRFPGMSFAAMHGNPWLRLLRREVEDLARTLHGEPYLREQQARTELARINRELRQLRARLAALPQKKIFGETSSTGAPRPCSVCPVHPRVCPDVHACEIKPDCPDLFR
jgi:hypothetical protein